MYLSQLSRVLNISANLPRQFFSLDYYLKRMPMLHQLSRKESLANHFFNVRIFIIHHITSEILAFLEALKNLGVEDINVLFVKYGGSIPSAYFDALLENMSGSFFSTALVRKMSDKNRNYYILSKAFSDISSLNHLNEVLKQKQLNYFDAMKLVAGHLFINFCIEAKKHNDAVLLIEDGGYLAPPLNLSSLKHKSTSEVFEQYYIIQPIKEELFSSWLDNILIGTIEHTRNGYNSLKKVKESYNRLQFPAYSIAISKSKTDKESQEVAHSILNALESVLHEQGMVLSRRKIAVLGSNGNIGKYLCRFLQNDRLTDGAGDLIEVDTSYTTTNQRQYLSIDNVPDNVLLSRDIFIGVIGESILQAEQLEKLVLSGEHNRLFFVSGSTKTLEFTHLSRWINGLASSNTPEIDDVSIHIEFDRILDPQSGLDQGGKAIIRFIREELPIKKEIFMPGDLSPINFLYYGVPTEIMDIVLSQLLKVSLGMTDQFKNGTLPHPDLYAVDHEINEWGECSQ